MSHAARAARAARAACAACAACAARASRRLALLTLGALPLACAAGEAAYQFSPVNQYGISVTAAYWNPILAYVSDKSGVRLQLKLGRSSADTTSFVMAREVDFVFSNHLFSPEREKMGWKVFARRDAPPVRGQIVVPADSPITALAQLAGKEVAFPGPEATVSYKFTYAQLLQQGIDVKVVFGGNSDGSLAQLFSGKVAAAGTNSQLAEGYARREGHAYRVLWSSPPALDLALLHSARVPAADAAAVARAFTGMHLDRKGREVLAQAAKVAGYDGELRFVASDGSEFGAYRAFYRSAPPQLR